MMMAVQVLGSILEAVGHTPLVRLQRITAGLRPTILAKVETINPGGSVKDRIGLKMIEDAERRGLLRPGGAIDVLVGGLGTGGTMTGAGRYLREKKPSLTLVGADPEGSLYSGDTIKPYKVEGIGEDFIPGTIDLTLFNRIVRVSDRDSFLTARRITREEGILVGGSAGTAMKAALEVARDLDASNLMVVILPDTGRNNMR